MVVIFLVTQTKHPKRREEGYVWLAVVEATGCDASVVTGTAALEEDAQILKVIEAYCTSAKTRQTLNSSKCVGHLRVVL